MSRTEQTGWAGKRWQKLIEGQRESGMSVKAYCRKKRIPDSGFYVWRKRLLGKNTPENGFIQLAPAKAIKPLLFEIQTPNGYSLKINSAMDEDVLSRVIRILRAA